MLVSIKSSSEDYSILKANIDIPWNCCKVKYYVTSIIAKANILILSSTDYINIKNGDTIKSVPFEDKYSLTIDELITMFRTKVTNITLTYNAAKRVFHMSAGSGYKISGISHRLSLLLGLYKVDVKQIDLSHKRDEKIVGDVDGYNCPDIPVLDYGNRFYLVSTWGGPVYNNTNYTSSIISSIDTFIKDGLPMLINYDSYNKPIKVNVNVEALNCVEMRLVDFMFQPIIIKSPIFATLKIKPADMRCISDKYL